MNFEKSVFKCTCTVSQHCSASNIEDTVNRQTHIVGKTDTF